MNDKRMIISNMGKTKDHDAFLELLSQGYKATNEPDKEGNWFVATLTVDDEKKTFTFLKQNDWIWHDGTHIKKV